MSDYDEALRSIKQAQMRANATGKPFVVIAKHDKALTVYPATATYARYSKILETVYPKGGKKWKA